MLDLVYWQDLSLQGTQKDRAINFQSKINF